MLSSVGMLFEGAMLELTVRWQAMACEKLSAAGRWSVGAFACVRGTESAHIEGTQSSPTAPVVSRRSERFSQRDAIMSDDPGRED